MSRIYRRPMTVRRLPLLFAALVISGLAAACSHSSHKAAHSPRPTTPPPTTPPKTQPPAPVSNASPLTGQPGGLGKPVVVVKIDNTSPSHPQDGIQDADVVYVEEVEGGLTRLAAVFSSRLPSTVGPVRSARTNDIELFGQYGGIGIVYAGANAGVQAQVARSYLRNINPSTSGGWFRSGGRHAPYNLFYELAAQIKARHDIAKVKPVGFYFSTGLPQGGGSGVHGVSVTFSGFASISFTWNQAVRGWSESMDGTPEYAATGARITANNVLVMYVRQHPDGFVDVLGHPTPYSVTTGTGRALLLRDGHAFGGRWIRKSSASPTQWVLDNGHTMTLKRGTTWVLLAPINGSVHLF